MQHQACPRPTAPRRVRGKGITRETVIEAALTLIDREGLAALKFRQLADELGATTMAPYSHFASKEQLLTAMTEHALGGLDGRLDAAAPWDEQIRTAMIGLHEVLSRHPGVADLVLARSEGERLDDLRDVLVAVTVNAGLDATDAEDALRALVSYVFGFVTLTRAGRPVTVRRGSPHAFEYGLTMLLDALKLRITTTQGAPNAAERSGI